MQLAAFPDWRDRGQVGLIMKTKRYGPAKRKIDELRKENERLRDINEELLKVLRMTRGLYHMSNIDKRDLIYKTAAEVLTRMSGQQADSGEGH